MSRHRRSQRHQRGEEATYACADGYLRVDVDGQALLAQDVVWALVHGEWPASELIHIDGDKHNNRIENLKQVNS